jgi:hypothetical protein
MLYIYTEELTYVITVTYRENLYPLVQNDVATLVMVTT